MCSWSHVSALEAVSMMIYEYAATQFSLTIYESTWVVCDVESKCKLCKQFHWWFLNLCVSSASNFVDDFWGGHDSIFFDYLWVNRGWVRGWIHVASWISFGDDFFVGSDIFSWIFLSKQGLCALLNPSIYPARSFNDDFWGSSEVVFLDYFWVNNGYVRWLIHSSTLEAISLIISESASTQISSTISKSTRVIST